MQQTLFTLTAVIAVAGALLTVTRRNAVHALLYLVVTMLAIAVAFFIMGASFAAALQVIVYGGAIMVLFVFVTMMLHQGPISIDEERELYQPSRSLGAAALCLLLLLELAYLLSPLNSIQATDMAAGALGAKVLGLRLYGPYVLVIELAALLLLSSLVGAFHIGRRGKGVASI